MFVKGISLLVRDVLVFDVNLYRYLSELVLSWHNIGRIY